METQMVETKEVTKGGKKTTIVTTTKTTRITSGPIVKTTVTTSSGSPGKPQKKKRCCKCCYFCCLKPCADKEEKEKKPQKLKDFIEEAVKAHNQARKKHGVPPLKHNKALDKLAQQWAEELSRTNVLKHSNVKYKGEQLGENVATQWTSNNEDYTGQQVVDQWYSEIEKFNWNSNTFQSGTGHFSQVVWKGSKEVGLGKVVGSDGRVFVVGNYHPAGNVMGKFPDNVFPPKK